MTTRTPHLAGVAAADWVWVGTHTQLTRHPATRGINQIPAGVILDHGDHSLLVAWGVPASGESQPAFTLDSLRPLTVVETLTCGHCGVRGRIEQGAWLKEDIGGR